MNLKMTDAQKTLYYIAENMKMEKKISDEGYEHFQQAIKALEQQPNDFVPLEVYKQVTSERDIAIEQLRELGYGFGEKIRTSDDCVSRQAIINMTGLSNWFESSDDYNNFVWELGKLPHVTPTHGTCKDCKHFHNVRKDFNTCDLWTIACADNHYCADYEKRGSENE